MRFPGSTALLLLSALLALSAGCSHDADETRVRISVAPGNCTDWNVDPDAGPVVAPTVRVELRVSGDDDGSEVELRDVYVSWERLDGGSDVPGIEHHSIDIEAEEGTWNVVLPLLSVEDLEDDPFAGLRDGSSSDSTIRLRAKLAIYGTKRGGWPLADSVDVEETFRVGGGCSNGS